MSTDNSIPITTNESLSVWKQCVRFAARSATLLVVVLSLWVIGGSIWFPLWWYQAIWQRHLWESRFFLSSLGYLLRHEMPFLLGICIILLAIVVSYRWWRRFLTWIDRWAILTILVCTLLVSGDALIIYKTQRWTATAYGNLENLGNVIVDAAIEIASLGSKPFTRIDPPVLFYYLDKPQVISLYNEIEPSLSEKERTVSTDSKASASGSVKGGPVEIKGEKSSGSTQTSAFKSTEFSPERKCLELINATVEQNTASYYTNSQEWKGREFRKYVIGVADAAKKNSTYRGGPLSDGERDLIRKQATVFAQNLESRMLDELKNLNGFVLVEGAFHKHIDQRAEAYFSEEFSVKPDPVSFRFAVPAWVKSQPFADGVRLRVYGNITHQLLNTNYIEIHPVAVF